MTFWISMLDAFYQSLVCFFIPYLVSHEVPFYTPESQCATGVGYTKFQTHHVFEYFRAEAPNW
jgi:hypothetical protein